MAVYQPVYPALSHRYREQAPSHIWITAVQLNRLHKKGPAQFD
ncbi:hypothetical protein C4J87_5015 [Pseudomonas sp. R1-43-08]|nr:hypothetical protein C4J87_5015 [Pseudomonas sp. R1-43-08]